MKRVFNYIAAATLLLCTTSCYDDVVQEYEFSAVYFAQQQPLRTIIDGRADYSDGGGIKVGAAVAGKLEIDLDDWSAFEIDESLISESSGLELMPEEYYTLSDENLMTITKANNFITEVEVNFTEEFFNDKQSINQKYAIPFALVASSCDSIISTHYYTVVAVKYISQYAGTYYNYGSTMIMNGDEVSTEGLSYKNSDLSQNITVDFTTLDRNIVSRTGQTLYINNVSVDNGSVDIELSDDGVALVTASSGNTSFVAGSGEGSYTYDAESYDCVINISYQFTSSSTTYFVEETLTRRQDPLLDLRVELWSEE